MTHRSRVLGYLGLLATLFGLATASALWWHARMVAPAADELGWPTWVPYLLTAGLLLPADRSRSRRSRQRR